VRYELGDFPFVGETPVEAMLARGAVQAAIELGLEAHDPWNEGREATYLLRGSVDMTAANAALIGRGFGWTELIDNGALPTRPGRPHVYHLAPAGTGKAFGVRIDRLHHHVARHETA